MARNGLPLQTAALLLLALLLFCWSDTAASDGAVDCCLNTMPNKIPQQLVKSYYVQTQEMGCRVEATVFITKRNKKLCAPPATEDNWVHKLINQLKRKSRRKHKGKKP